LAPPETDLAAAVDRHHVNGDSTGHCVSSPGANARHCPPPQISALQQAHSPCLLAISAKAVKMARISGTVCVAARDA
jgi:hypothetical protein